MDDDKDILDKVFDDSDEKFEKVSDDANKDIIEKVSDDVDNIFEKVSMKTYLKMFPMMVMTYLNKHKICA